MKTKTSELTYQNYDGETRIVRGCKLTVDELDRYWIWSEQLKINLAFKTKGQENAYLTALDSLLSKIELMEKRMRALQRIADLASDFADSIKGEND